MATPSTPYPFTLHSSLFTFHTSQVMEFDFPKSMRLLKSAEFDCVFRRRCSFADGLIIVYFAPRQLAIGEIERPRLGLVVSRKCGNAVVRNRWKRALREAFRLVQHELPGHLDLVVLPQRGAKPEVARLEVSFKQLAAKAVDKLATVKLATMKPATGENKEPLP